ncbi:MAG: hypothetical protein ACE10K_09915, partial [Rhodothermales bacterium]
MNDGQRTAATSKPFRVGFPLYPNCTLVDFAGATQVFAFTSRRFKPIWLAPTMDSIVTSEGVSVVPNYTFDEAKNHRPLDMLFIPGGGTETRHNSDPY